MMMNDKDKMHPDDRRNMIIFIIAAVCIWISFDRFILQPKMQAMVQARQAIEQQAALSVKNEEAQAAIIRPRTEVIGADVRIPVKTPALSGTIALKGNRFDDLSLQNYYETLEKKDRVVLLSPSGTPYPRYAEAGWLSDDKSIILPDKDSVWQRSDAVAALTPETPVALYWDNGQGLRFERRIAIDARYMITQTLSVQNNSGREVILYPYSLVSEHGLPKDFEGYAIVHEGPIGYVGKDLIEHSYKKIAKEGADERLAAGGWIGITAKYWFTGLIPPQEDPSKFRFLYVPPQTEGAKERFQVDLMGSPRAIPAGGKTEYALQIFSGAKEVKTLVAYEKERGVPHFDLVVDFGLFYFLTKPFFYILDFMGRLFGNFGLAILGLTVVVRACVFPLVNTTYRSFAQLKKVAPQMHELRERYGSDREKLQQELVKLYEKEKVNPMSGCLPILVQIPIFFALYKVLMVTIEMRHAPFFGWIKDLSAHDPLTVFNLFGVFDYNVPMFLMIGPWSCLMFVFMLLQKQMNPPSQDKIQQGIADAMPFLVTFMLAKFSAGLVIYWTFSNFFSLIQQYVIMRSMGVEVKFWHGKGTPEAQAEKDVKDGPVVHPELALLEKQAEEAIAVTPPKPKKKKKK